MNTSEGNYFQTLKKNKHVFPALNYSKNFSTMDYDAHIHTKIDHTIIQCFRSMTVQDLNTFHTVCE